VHLIYLIRIKSSLPGIQKKLSLVYKSLIKLPRKVIMQPATYLMKQHRLLTLISTPNREIACLYYGLEFSRSRMHNAIIHLKTNNFIRAYSTLMFSLTNIII